MAMEQVRITVKEAKRGLKQALTNSKEGYLDTEEAQDALEGAVFNRGRSN